MTMKKLLSILSAGLLALVAFSCVKEEFATFDDSKATAPVIGSYEMGEKALTISFTPGAFNTGFNDKMPVNHSIILASVNGKTVNKPLTASIKDGQASVSVSNLSKALIALGCQEGDVVSMDIFIRASMQAPSQDNGRNGFVDSQGLITISGFEVVVPVTQGNPWETFTEKSDWSLIGSIASTGNGWNKDETAYTTPDGKQHVAKNIKLTPDDQFKFRYKGGWDVNRGAPGDDEPYKMNAGDEVEAVQNGKNLGVNVEGNYDILYDEDAETITITEAFQTYPGFDDASTWGVTGSIASRGLNWDKDVSMITDGEWHVAEGVTLTKDDQFKFRNNQQWTENFGAPGDTEPFIVTIDAEESAIQNGKNLAVAEDGVYDLMVNPAAGLYKIVVSLGGYSPLVGEGGGDEPEPEPEPEPVTGWNLIGVNGDWNNDILATEINGIWTAYITVEDATEFKWRKDGGWDENYGGAMAAVGEPFEAVHNGDNVPVAAGSWKIELDPENKTITVNEVVDAYPDFKETSPWSVIGSIASRKIGWDGDVSMRTDGTWHVAEGVALTTSDQFKFRKDQAWDTNIGGPDGSDPFVVTLDTEIEGFANGKNLAVPEDGVYDILVNPDAGLFKVVVSLGGYSPNIDNGEEPEPEPGVTGWNLIGLNGDWDNDVLASESNGVWTAYVSVSEATEFKWRKDAGWDENYGGDIVAVGEPFDAVAGGSNIPLEPGFWKVELNTETLKITVSEGKVWSLIGNFNSWAGDVDMVQGEDGNWVAENVGLTAGWKIRYNHGWDVNRGGTFAELGQPFEVTAGGADIDCGEGQFTVTYNPTDETITVTEAKTTAPGWSVIGANGDWENDVDMTEVMPGVWISPEITTTTDWKVRYDHGWDVNRGGDTPSAEGVFVKAVPGGNNVGQTGTFRVVYNANNETLGTLVWGVVGSIASIEGFNWNNDVPMNLGTDGKWYSIPIALGEGDEIKIRKYAAWDENRGGDCESANAAFAVTGGGNNIKAPAAGTYMLVYDPEAETITLSTEFWGLIGDFNSWGGDVFMICNGGGLWSAYGQTITGGWKIRQGAGWDVNRGGTFVEQGTAFAVINGGDNINAGELTGFDVIYDSTAETITVW